MRRSPEYRIARPTCSRAIPNGPSGSQLPGTASPEGNAPIQPHPSVHADKHRCRALIAAAPPHPQGHDDDASIHQSGNRLRIEMPSLDKSLPPRIPAKTHARQESPLVPSNRAIRRTSKLKLPLNVIPNSIGRERSDRRSKSSQHNLQDLLSSEPRENPPSKGDSLATRPAEQGRGMFTAVRTTATLQIRHESLRHGKEYRTAYTKACPPPIVMPGPDRASSQYNLKDFYHGTIRQSPTAPSRERSRKRLRVFPTSLACFLQTAAPS